MTEDHERIEELLAGHAIGALEGEDRAEADRLLTDHVPTCITCRTALEESFMVSADLALAAPPVEPPELLWRQLRREVLAPPAPRRRRSILTWSSAITAAAAVLGLAVWNTTLNSRISDEARTQRQVSTAFAALADPAAKKIRLDSSTEPSSLAGAYTRQAHLTIIGVDIPNPAPGHTYRVWFVGRSGNLRARDFRPADGLVILNLSVDPTRFTELVITEEPVGRAGTGPAGIPRWTTRL